MPLCALFPIRKTSTAPVPEKSKLFSSKPGRSPPKTSLSPLSKSLLPQLQQRPSDGGRQTDKPGSTPAGTHELCNCRDVTWSLCLRPRSCRICSVRTATPSWVQQGEGLPTNRWTRWTDGWTDRLILKALPALCIPCQPAPHHTHKPIFSNRLLKIRQSNSLHAQAQPWVSGDWTLGQTSLGAVPLWSSYHS